ncbi:DHHA1 domain-containing protein [Aquibacillus koreensis]|uniref:DHHA1 domain-containing protein n=1 Tax=Aquibacillus koreensis TaxID=279446 RepID=A0A9X3WLE2_9BACI|nr:DHHA1 domain-containing protein [Aquibacillus koreensis]MCT2536947.1 DHHA1 domain-containing protein [Aquibacillus koreensis]MDC3421922.1 DHHA1 domain-containing protein [Aquibacillus koreensis]
MIYHNRPLIEIQELAKAITMQVTFCIVLFINETDQHLQVVCGRSTEPTANMNLLIKEVLPKINGRGGGKNSFAQGGGEKITSAEEVMQDLIDTILKQNE